MPRRPLDLLAALLCSAALAGAPCFAQAPVAPAVPPSANGAPGLSKAIPFKREDAVPQTSSAGLAAAGLVLALAAAAGFLVLRRGLPGAGRPWKARFGGGAGVVRVSSQALTPQASIHVVRWNDEELLLACTAQRVSLVARRPLPATEGGAP